MSRYIVVNGDRIILSLTPRTEQQAKDMAARWLRENCHSGAKVTVYKAVSETVLTETTTQYTTEVALS